MSRYYRIVITDPNSGKVVTPPGFDGLLGGATYTSFVNGKSLPGAWNVLLDVPVAPFATPFGSALVTIYGISLAEIGQANDLVGKTVAVYAGMQKGLPLANPAQSGLIVQGYVFQAFGNWIGVDQTLELVINPGTAPGGTGTIQAPKNIVLNWTAGSKLSIALANALSTAFPGFQQTININANIVRPNDEVGYFQTVAELAAYVKEASKNVIKTKNYPGVDIQLSQKNFNVYDESKSSSTTQIVYQDLIGQPTWIESPLIQLKTVMRADLSVGGVIKLPKTLVTNTQQANSSLVNQKANFQGDFVIATMRHVGNFRQPDAASWVTVIDAYPKAA